MTELFVVPLESNPDVLNKYLEKLGVAGNYQFVDVYSLDDDSLSFIPKPIGLIFLFPYSDIYKSHSKKETEALSANPPPVPENLFYMRQYVRNSCGTMALIHTIFNNMKSIELKDGSVIKSFYEKAKSLNPEERGKLLEENKDFIACHEELATEGQTVAPASEDPIDNHFISLVNVGNELFELDGTKGIPVSHGKTSEETFLADAAKVCKEFIARDPKEVNFTIMAFASAE